MLDFSVVLCYYEDMRKIFCDLCGDEITEQTDMRGTFTGKNSGLLVEVIIKAPKISDVCKGCVIKIIRDGKTLSWKEYHSKS